MNFGKHTIQQRLHDEIAQLREGLRKIDNASRAHSDQWSRGLYERLIARRERMLEIVAA